MRLFLKHLSYDSSLTAPTIHTRSDGSFDSQKLITIGIVAAFVVVVVIMLVVYVIWQRRRYKKMNKEQRKAESAEEAVWWAWICL
jgi:heme/copper-type cytochrome/quinol oxidase subunit 2